MKPRCDVAQDSCESVVILWCGNERVGKGGEMMRRPEGEPVPCMLFRAQQERDSRDLQFLH